MNFPQMFANFFLSIGPLFDVIKDNCRLMFIGGLKRLRCLPGFNEKQLLASKVVFTLINCEERGTVVLIAQYLLHDFLTTF